MLVNDELEIFLIEGCVEMYGLVVLLVQWAAVVLEKIGMR